jgi:Xaa-Pro aminopeptidase
MTTNITISEYAARRERVLAELGGSVGLVFAGEGSAPLLGKWYANKYFTYLTGIVNEPGAVLLFDPSAPDPTKKITLFLSPLNPEAEVWDGYREPLGTELKSQYGFQSVYRLGVLPGMLTGAARRTKKLACLHPFSTYPAAVSPDLAIFRQVTERVLGVGIEDQTQLLIRHRAVKSEAEIALMRHAATATIDGYAAALSAIAPNKSERDVDSELTRIFQQHGGTHAYNPIVGSGLSATIFHYMDNNGPLNTGELVLIDAGAAIGGYATDVTRTFPVSGKFTPEQKSLYNLVLEAMEAAIATLEPGVHLWEADNAARAVFIKAGYPDAYPYSVGHPLGLDVHEAAPDGPLLEGMIVTIEPGIYLPQQKLGIRIEDDLLITKTGSENLTATIPKTIEAIEAAMAR